jgi:hypothetical protein
MLEVLSASRICAMNLETQSSSKFIAVRKRRQAFKARAIHASRKIPVAMSAAGGTSAIFERSAKNIANWSSYLPSDCVDVMISLGWDRTT